MIEDPPAWLFHPIPLWVFLLALMTAPWKWNQYAKRVMKRLDPWGGSGDE